MKEDRWNRITLSMKLHSFPLFIDFREHIYPKKMRHGGGMNKAKNNQVYIDTKMRPFNNPYTLPSLLYIF